MPLYPCPSPASRRTRVPLCPTLIVSLLLAACGGGGSELPGLASAEAADGRAGSLLLRAPPSLPAVQVPRGENTFVCRDVAVTGQSIDNLKVPAGAACVLRDVRLNGSLQVDAGARLDGRRLQVNGNVQAQGASDLLLADASRIGGSVQFEQGGSAMLVGLQVNGDIQLKQNAGLLQADANRLGGNLQAEANRGGVVLTANTADGNLQCQQNSPAPTGGGNRAASKEDQCRAL